MTDPALSPRTVAVAAVACAVGVLVGYRAAPRDLPETAEMAEASADPHAGVPGAPPLAGRGTEEDVHATLDALRAAAEAAPDSPQAQRAYGAQALMTGHAPDAVAPLERAVGLDPDDPIARSLLGMAYVETGRADDGVRELERSLEARPDHPMTLFFLFETAAGRGDRARARRYGERLLEVAPGMPMAEDVRRRLAEI